MSDRTDQQTSRLTRRWGPPTQDCPAWCQEHAVEAHRELLPGEIFVAHRREIYRFGWSDRDVDAVHVMCAGISAATMRSRIYLTMWPGDPDKEAQHDLRADEARELADALNRAADLLDAAIAEAADRVVVGEL